MSGSDARESADAFLDACKTRKDFVDGCKICDALKKMRDHAFQILDEFQAQPTDDLGWQRFDEASAKSSSLLDEVNRVSKSHTCIKNE